MKKSLVVSLLCLIAGLGFGVSASAQSITCDDVVWSADVLANNPNIGDYCLEVVEKDGKQVARLHARVVRQSVNSTIVQWQHPDGSWSPSERRYPEKDFAAHMDDGSQVRILDLAPRQDVNVYVPMSSGTWSVPTAAAPAAAAPAAAPAAPPPAPMAEPEPEPAPAALPTTATQLPLLALLGGLMVLLGGAIGLLRSRL